MLILSLVMMAAACERAPVVWEDLTGGAAPMEPGNGRKVAIVPSERACLASVRAVQSGRATFAVWWDARPDSSAVLMLARSTDDGIGWEPVVAADTTDHSARGCSRFPPAIAADSASGYVHLAYFVEPAQGPGLFYAHSMDGGRTMHAPVPIVFGRNPSRVSMASSGERVALAYEDPNSVKPSIGLALSRTMGHIFEERVRASPENVRAKQPVVALEGDSIKVWWSVYSANPTVSATRPGYRMGRWQ